MKRKRKPPVAIYEYRCPHCLKYSMVAVEQPMPVITGRNKEKNESKTKQ